MKKPVAWVFEAGVPLFQSGLRNVAISAATMAISIPAAESFFMAASLSPKRAEKRADQGGDDGEFETDCGNLVHGALLNASVKSSISPARRFGRLYGVGVGDARLGSKLLASELLQFFCHPFCMAVTLP
jgi:hypothetical protein